MLSAQASLTEVKSEKSGAEAVHKPDALQKDKR